MTIDIAPVHHLELVAMGERAWRLFDHASTAAEEGTLIAYVEKLSGGSYETVWVVDGPRVDLFRSLEEVLATAARRMSTVVSADSKPVPIPHRAPLAFR